MQGLKAASLPRDAWASRPVVLSLFSVLVLGLICGIPGAVSFLLIPFSLLFFALAGIALLAASIFAAVKSRPRKAASFLAALVMPALLWWPILWVTNCIHLALTIWLGMGVLGPIQKPDGHGFVVYDWSVGLAGSPSTFLVRDETDRIGKSVNLHAHPAETGDDWIDGCAGRTRHLLGHYYLCNPD